METFPAALLVQRGYKINAT